MSQLCQHFPLTVFGVSVIAIEHNYGVSVLICMLYTFSVLMEDASVG